MTIKKGDKVKVEYTGTFEDGTVFDSSEKAGRMLEFEVGEGKIIKGFDKAVVGMKKGEEKEVKMGPKDGYGDYNPELIRKIPKDKFPPDKKVKVGMMLGLQSPNRTANTSKGKGSYRQGDSS